MSPILVRPVREQFEHDRVIRVLQARYRRKYEVAINPGSELNTAVDIGENPMYPDLILFSQERGRKLQGTVEVETGESINTLEAMAEWGPFSRLRAPFYLYVPPNSLDTVKRLCAEHLVEVSEIWTYHTAADQVRFTMVHRAPESAFNKQSRPVAKIIERPAVPVKIVEGDSEVEEQETAANNTKAPGPPRFTNSKKAAAAKVTRSKPRKTASKKTAAKAARPTKRPARTAAKAARPAKGTKSAKGARAAKARRR